MSINRNAPIIITRYSNSYKILSCVPKTQILEAKPGFLKSRNMAYKLRARKQKRPYVSCDDDDDGHESDSSRRMDPDFTRNVRPRRSNTMITESAEQRRAGRPPKRTRKSTPSAGEASTSGSKPAEYVARTIMSWLIDHGMIIENEKIYYVADREGDSDDGKRSKKELLMKGRARREGVQCECCNEVMTVWDFENHTGSVLQRPYEHIHVARSNSSLLQCQFEVWQSNVEVERRTFNEIVPRNGASDKHDDACLICADGGDLICCEKCWSTSHLKCMGLERIPQGDWICPYCVCKHCYKNDKDLPTCVQCDKKYHWQCLVSNKELDLNASGETLACDSHCGEVYEKLQSLVGVKHELEGGFCWTLLQRMEPDNLDFKDLHLITECNSKISLAWEVLDECFTTIIDRHTQINVVQSVAYSRGSNLNRINFRGFYTAILEKNDDIISAATIRVHGTDLAEMPFIGTRHLYRQNGMSRMLLVTLESIFSVMGVEHLIIPSVQELTEMWEGKCGFSPVEDVVSQKITDWNTLTFPGAVRLQKALLSTPPSSPSAVMNADVAEDVDEGVDMVSDNCAKLAGLDLNHEYTESGDEEVEDK
ncbi:increased DNA methylation 1 isoform X1 [Populus alba x Populus x berolinensis]|nr:increased DNA methylation 1 isoform X1 [Populus alba x Populus x berolinensis]